MKRKSLLIILLLALGVPIAAWSQSSLPFQQNFNNVSLQALPQGWAVLTSETVGTGSVQVFQESSSNTNRVLTFGITALRNNFGAIAVQMPANTSSVTYMKMSFKYKSTSANSGTFRIGYNETTLSGNTYNPVAEYSASSSSTINWVQVNDLAVNLPRNKRLLLGMITQAAQTGWMIDNINITDGYCPSNVASSGIGDNAATITWTANDATLWQVRYKANSVSDWTILSGIQNINSCTLSNLLVGTSYDVQVRAKSPSIIGDFYSGWSEIYTFTTTGCAVPTNVQVYANPAEGVTVSWEGNANLYNIQYENIETWQSAYHNGLVVTSGNSYTFNGTESVPVVPGMRYILRVQAQCDPSTASEWSEWVEFTNCLTYMDLPLHANFDYIPTNWSSLPHADLPGCWSRINNSTDPEYEDYPLVENNQSLCHSNYYPQGLYNYIRFNMPENGPDQYLVLAPVDPVNDVTISFWVRCASSETSYSYNVGLMPDNFSTDDFYAKDGYNFGGVNTDYYQNSYTFTAEELSTYGNYIVIWARSSSTTATSFCIDDIDIYPANYHCGEPVNVHAENIGATLAHIVWENPVTGGGEWSVRYKKATDEDWTYKYDGGLVSLGCDLDNLESNTTYTVAVRDNCNDIDHSEWVEATFTTLDVIPVPTNLHVFTDYLGNQHIGSSWVDLAWDCTPVEGQSEVDRYGLEVSDDGETWYGPQPNAYWGTVATQCIVDPISPGTHYVRVRALEFEGNVVTEGNWSEPLQFNIEECDEVVTIQPGDSSETYDFNECPPLPDCWTVYGDIPYGISINYNALYFDFRDEVEAKYVELEEFLVTEDYSGLVVSFDWRHAAPVADNTTNMTVQLQYCLGQENENWQDAGEPISVFKDGLTEPQWSTYTRMIPYGYWTRLRLKYTVTDYQEFSSGTNPYCLIDNLVITGRPYCANPTKWRVVPETYGGRVIWDKVAAAMSYDIAYQVDGDAEWESVEGVEGYEYTADSLFFDMTGLLANTTYRVKMKSECSNQWPENYVTFTTSDFGSFNELMYTFEEGMPVDFSVSGAGAANVSVSTEQSFGADPHSLKYDFVSGSPYPSQALAYVEIGNCLNTREFNDFLVYFDMYCTDVANTYETVYLQYKAFGSDGWEENWRSAGTWYNSYDSKGWVERHATFSIPNELQGTVSKLRFRLVFTDHGSGESTYIDNLRIFPKGSCINVSGIDIVAQESTSATFQWNDPNYEAGTTQSVGFTIRYRNLTISTETYTGWIEIPVWVDASNPTQQYSITLNELDPSSYYVFDIRTLCSDGGYTVWSSLHQHFVTDCQPYELNDMEPFVEDFNDIDLACWTYNTRWGRIYDGHGGSNWSLRSNKLDVSGWNDYIDTPEIELDPNYVSKGSSYLVLRFWTKCSSGDGTDNKVKVLVGNQEVEIYEMPAYGCDQWQQVDLSLSRWLPDNNGSNTISVRFDHGSDATAEWFIDDVVITSWDQVNYGTRVFDDAFGNDWTNDDNWYPNGAPSYSPSMDVTLMGQAWALANSESTVGTMRFGTQGYLDVQPGSNLTITTVDIPENKVFVEPGATLNIGTAHFSFDKVFHQVQEGIYNITNLNNNDHWLSFNYGTTILGTVTLTSPGKITVLNTWNATTVNSSGQFEVYHDANVTIGTLNAAEVSPLGFLIQGTANITTLNASGETAVLVQDGGVLNTTTIVNTNHNALVIEDGGQVKSANSFNGIIQKNITGYGAGNENLRSNWYLIASPIAATVNTTLVPEIIDELDFDMVDFYMFDQGQALEWENVKCDVAGGCASPYGTYPNGSIYAGQMVNTQEGYLYACQDNYTASFSTSVTGNAFPATNVDIASRNGLLGYSAGADFAGMNLIGNPYTCNAYLKQGDDYVPFYRMNATGDAIIGVPAGTPVKPCEGVFVCCTEPSSTVTFTTDEPASAGETQNGPAVVLPMHSLFENQDASLAAQTIALAFASGWNWWAPMVQITAAQLRAALDPNLQHLMTKTGEVATDAVLEPGQMYKIQTNADVDGVTITGVPMAANISIGEDFNWIGYTGGTTDDISSALTSYGITPNIGDKIISQDGGFAIFNGTTWQGTLTQLTQGQGYVYVR